MTVGHYLCSFSAEGILNEARHVISETQTLIIWYIGAHQRPLRRYAPGLLAPIWSCKTQQPFLLRKSAHLSTACSHQNVLTAHKGCDHSGALSYTKSFRFSNVESLISIFCNASFFSRRSCHCWMNNAPLLTCKIHRKLPKGAAFQLLLKCGLRGMRVSWDQVLNGLAFKDSSMRRGGRFASNDRQTGLHGGQLFSQPWIATFWPDY